MSICDKAFDCGYTKQHFGVMYEYYIQVYFDEENYKNCFL